MANYGIGIGSFAQGLSQGLVQGMKFGQQLKASQQQNVIEEASQKALDQAKQDRSAAVDAQTRSLMGLGPQGPQAPQASPTQAAPETQRSIPSPQVAGPQAVSPNQQPIPPSPDQTNPQSPSSNQATSLPGSAAPTMPVAPSNMSSASPVTTPIPPGPTTSAISSMPIASGAGKASPSSSPVTQGLPTSTSPMTAAEARALADKSAPSVMDFFQKQGVPRIAEAYLAQGDPAKAQAWTDWADQTQNKQNMAVWAKGWRAVQMGDPEGAADNFMQLYKSYNDGTTPISKEVVKDKDGNLTGFNVKLKNDATGEVRSSFIDKNQLLNLGLAQLAPPQLFETAWQQKQAADKAKTAADAEVGKVKLNLAANSQLEGLKQQGRLQLQQKQGQQQIDAKIGALKSAGYSDSFIKDALPDILGVNQYKKSTSPEEAKRLAFSDRMKNDPMFRMKPPDQQRSIIQQDMGLIYGGLKPSAYGLTGEQPAPSVSTQPAVAAGAAAATTTPPALGRIVMDPKTGKPVILAP
jgi:hypothetical protein